MKLLSTFVFALVCNALLGLSALAEQDTEAVFEQVKEQSKACGRGINRSAEAQACEAACEGAIFNLHVLLRAVPQPIPAEIMAQVEECNAAYAVFNSTAPVSEAPAEDPAEEVSAATPVEPKGEPRAYPELTAEITGFLANCETVIGKTRHKVACLKFCKLSLSDLEKLEGGDPELARQLSRANGDPKRLSNLSQCQRMHGFATR